MTSCHYGAERGPRSSDSSQELFHTVSVWKYLDGHPKEYLSNFFDHGLQYEICFMLQPYIQEKCFYNNTYNL